jgi:outer membrane cobalamin receptor
MPWWIFFVGGIVLKQIGIYLWSSLICLVGASSLLADTEDDTLRTYWMDEVVVVGTRLHPKDVSATTTFITSKTIDLAVADDINDVVQLIPGAFVRRPYPLGRADLQLRGWGDLGRRMVVLVDDRPDKMGLFGCVIGQSLPLDNVDHIEVIRGSSSVLYGSDAIGGVLRLVTRRPGPEMTTRLRASYGSYNRQDLTLRHSGSLDRLSYQVTGSIDRTDGHRDNADADAHDGSLRMEYSLGPDVEVSSSFRYYHGKIGSPGPETAPTPEALPDDFERGAVDLSLRNRWGGGHLKAMVYGNYGHHQLADGWHSKDGVWGANIECVQKDLLGVRVISGAEYRNYSGRRLPTEPDYVEAPDAWAGPEVQWERDEYALYTQGERGIWPGSALSLGVRVQHDEIYGNEFSPHVGVVQRIGSRTRLRFSANRAFRSPQINELYVFPPSHTDLEPERLWTYEVGLDQTLLEGASFGVVIFRSKGDNLIQTVPNAYPPPPYRFSNTGEFQFDGLETTFEYTPNPKTSLSVAYAHLDPGGHTAGRPLHKATATVHHEHRLWTLWVQALRVWEYYASDDRSDRLPDYLLLDSRMIYTGFEHVRPFVAVENILNEEYQLELDYPMPGRTVSAGCELSW